MQLTKLTCPHCRATLKPARPVPEGKTIKCPKCQRPFKAAGDEAAEAAPVVAAAEEVDEEGGTYGIIMEKNEKEEVRKKKKRQDDDEDDEDEDEDDDDEDDIVQQYLKNRESKDPRGPAQAIVVGPSNWLLRIGLVGFFGWIILLVVFLIPIIFPNVSEEEEDPGGKGFTKEKEKEKKTEGGDEEAAVDASGALAWFRDSVVALVIFGTLFGLGIVQSALIAYGAVKLQGLESRGWGIASCILAMFPYHSLPAWTLVAILANLIFPPLALVALFLLVWGPLFGIWSLTQVIKPEVRAGIEYKAD
jgi:hypothetical protein